MKSIFNSYYFWILFFLVSMTSIWGIYKLFPLAFPLINVDLKMNRSQALAKADELAHRHHWLPITYNQAATFQTDNAAKTFVELNGGIQGLTTMMNNNLYMPYYWAVRHYVPHDTHETVIYFTPSGAPYAFKQTLAETDTGENLTENDARALAEKVCTEWAVDLSHYNLIENSKEVKPSKRIDHTFVYERTSEKIGNGKYRLKVVVSGDIVTMLDHYIKIPESFSLYYKELRSANNSIASAATIAWIILYVICGCIITLFFIRYTGYFQWHKGLLWGSLLAFFELLSQLSSFPLLWAYYDTATSPYLFLMQHLITRIMSCIIHVGFYTFIFSVAETFTRKAFGSHPQLWKVWNINAASSWQVWGRTIAGYLIVPLDLIFAMSVYIIAQKYFGWWIPAGVLTDPNILAEYAPWLSAFTSSFAAGFLEECLFRAIPLASAAIWGERFGKKKLFIAIAFIIQIIVFGAAHANYATQPAYARIIELIIPSSIFGGLYLAFGLLPAILSHVTFDVFWFALPLFISRAPWAWINQVLVLALTFIPLFVILYARLRTGSWHTLTSNFYNKSWKPSVGKSHTIVEDIQIILHKKISWFLLSLTILSLLATSISLVKQKNNAPPLLISRTEAIAKAKEILEQHNIHLDAEWQALSIMQNDLQNFPDEHQYIWEETNDLYTTFLHSYLKPVYWLIRFVRFTGTTSQRAEEYQISLTDLGTLIRFKHIIPEDVPGKTITKEKARDIAEKSIQKEYNLSPAHLREISAQEIMHPARKDWIFTFVDTSYQQLIHDEPQIHALISGDTISDLTQFISIPEEWERLQNDKKTIAHIIKNISFLLAIIIFITCLSFMVFYYIHSLKISKFVALFIGLLIINIFVLLNQWPMIKGSFNTAAPFGHQLLITVGMSLVTSIIYAGMYSFVIQIIFASYRPHTSNKTMRAWLISICCGIIIVAFNQISNFLQITIKPFWANYSSLGAYIPINFGINIFFSWLMLSCAFTSLIFCIEYARKLHYNRYLLGGIFIVSFTALLSYFSLTPMNITWSLLQQFFLGTLFWILYEWYLHFDYALISTIFAIYYCVLLVQQAWLSPYPLAPLSNFCSAIIILIASWYWFKKTNMKRI